MGGNAQGAHKVVQTIPFLELIQGQGGAADLLEDYGDQVVFRAGDGQRDPLTLLVHTENNKLACLSLGSYQRRIH